MARTKKSLLGRLNNKLVYFCFSPFESKPYPTFWRKLTPTGYIAVAYYPKENQIELLWEHRRGPKKGQYNLALNLTHHGITRILDEVEKLLLR